jgi:ubiquinone/menaquinone biosynthesis C-methylase UbiE
MARTLLDRIEDRLSYGMAQVPRVAWYLGHGYVMRRLAARFERDRVMRPAPAQGPRRPSPARAELYRDLAALFARDLANVDAGYYPPPVGEDGTLAERLARTRLFFEDLPRVAERRRAGRGQEVSEAPERPKRPRYYLQNFHFQTDGWLSERSAKLYDVQVEVLFAGAANAMRRQALVPIADWMRGKDQRRLRLVDIACGTARFLVELKRAFPLLPTIGLDLSEPYLHEARRSLAGRRATGFVGAKAEELPFADASLDIVTSVYLFHELPPKIRRAVAREVSRVLKPGGLFVLVDSLQHGDVPGYDGLLDGFPTSFHEPYFASYVDEDLPAMFGDAGLRFIRAEPAWLSKVVACEKPGG